MIWSMKWHIENRDAWFVGGQNDFLFHYSKDSNVITFLGQIPNNIGNYKGHPLCIKNNNSIYCLPDTGNNIYRYSIENSKWECIKLVLDSVKRIGICCANVIDNKIVMLSSGLAKILVLDTDSLRITEKAILPDMQSYKGEIVGDWNGSKLIIAFENNIIIFDYDIDQIVKKYQVPIDDKIKYIRVINNDVFFWGLKKRIYNINLQLDKINIYDKFPETFGEYQSAENGWDLITNTNCFEYPVFIDVIGTQQRKWFIPFMGNEILFLDNDSDEGLKVFNIKEEIVNDTKLYHEWNWAGRYLVQGIIGDRFIVLYSFTNNCYIEIDTDSNSYRIFRSEFDQDSISNIINVFRENNLSIMENDYCGLSHLLIWNKRQ